MKNFPLRTDSAQALAFARAVATLASLAALTTTLATAQTTLVERDSFAPFHQGADAAPIDDLDGDNIADILVWSRGPDPTSPVASTTPPFVEALSGLTLETLRTFPVPATWTGPMGATPIADHDGDGLRDIAIHIGALSTPVGEVRIMSSATGQLISTLPTTPSQWSFGFDVLDLGDVSGDGISDYAVSEPSRQLSWGTGLVNVLSGADDQLIYSTIPPILGQYDFGRVLHSLGDLDGDGVPDFAASYSRQQGNTPPNSFYALSGATGEALWSAGGLFSFGASLAVLDDMDGDGTVDIAAAFDGYCSSPPQDPSISIHSGKTGLRLANITQPAGSLGCDDLSLSRTDDLDADGFADLAVGVRHLLPNTGVVSRVVFLSSVTGTVLGTIEGSVKSNYGLSIAMTADLNEDGVSEVVVGGSLQPGPGGDYPGYVSIVSPVDSIPLRLVDGAIQWDNSTGNYTTIGAFGSAVAADNDVTLFARNMPPASFGFFIAAPSPGALPTNIGFLLLSGPVGRFVGPGQIQQSDAEGRFSLPVDLTQWPTPTGFISVTAGQTWYVQAWHRDTFSAGPTSRLSDRFEITFE